MQNAKFPRFETTMWGDVAVDVETRSLILQPVAPDTNSSIVLEVENLAGTTTASINGNGDIIAKTITTGATTNVRTGTNNNVLGGNTNSVSASNSLIGGGNTNTISSSGTDNVILNGQQGSIGTTCFRSMIGTGFLNALTANTCANCAIVSGTSNSIIGGVTDSSCIATGTSNVINGTDNAFIGGGSTNSMTNNSLCFIGGGYNNQTTALAATICGGSDNKCNGLEYCSIMGGVANTASGKYSSVLGGANAVANQWGQAAWAGGNAFAVVGDSQVSRFTLRNLAITNIGYIMYLDYPQSTTNEISMGNTSWGILDLNLVCVRLLSNTISTYKNSYWYTTNSGAPGANIGSMALGGLFDNGTASMTAPTLAIISNNIIRITANVSTTADCELFAYVTITHYSR